MHSEKIRSWTPHEPFYLAEFIVFPWFSQGLLPKVTGWACGACRLVCICSVFPGDKMHDAHLCRKIMEGTEKAMAPTPVLLPGKSHGWRSLVGCSPWGCEESDTTERLHFHFSLSCIGEGNGNPLQRSCLENPRNGGTWWAAVCGVAESDTTKAT